MICKVRETVSKFNLINESIKTVAIGLSGGADSVCLLHVLSKLKDEYGIILKAVHINHNIRGEEAQRDENFVRVLCDLYSVELQVYSVDVPALALQRKISLEECGRQVRYEKFAQSGCDAVAVAHTLSDSIETMLFNLARGTGVKGLSGISPSREPNIIRPLISCTRAEIEKYCTDNGLAYVTDSTNLSDDYTRNHIRHNIVPSFAKINVDFENAFMRAMNSLYEENSFFEENVRVLIENSRTENGYLRNFFVQAHPAVLKRGVLEIIKEQMKKPPESRHIDACCHIITAGKGKIEIAKDLYILVKDDIISFSRSEKKSAEWKSYPEGGAFATPYGSFKLTEVSSAVKDCFDEEKITDNLYLSSRQQGDRFTFKGRGLTKSLKKLFNEMKIPQSDRNRIAVLHDGENVVWVENIGVNAMYIPDEKTQKIIKIKKEG